MNSLRSYARVVFFTGAGMSAESGVPTYRGKGGIWDQYDYQDVACQKAFFYHETIRLPASVALRKYPFKDDELEKGQPHFH